jgi:hypothetical protein
MPSSVSSPFNRFESKENPMPDSAKLLATGPVFSIKRGKTPEGVLKTAIQFARNDANGGTTIISVRLPDGHDGAGYEVGQQASIPVEITMFKEALFYKAVLETPGAAPRSSSEALRGKI